MNHVYAYYYHNHRYIDLELNHRLFIISVYADRICQYYKYSVFTIMI